MDPTIVVSVVTGTFALVATVLGLRASGRVPQPPTPPPTSSSKTEAEELAWTIARSTMRQQQDRNAHLEARVLRLEAQLRAAGHTPDDE